MSKSIVANSAKIVDNVRKTVEYQEFLNMVGTNNIPDTWELTAEALGVHPNTIKGWKKLPEFKEAKRKGIEHCLKEMRRSGKDDWRQWETSLRLLGVKTEQAPSVNVQVNIPILGGKSVQSNNSDQEIIGVEQED